MKALRYYLLLVLFLLSSSYVYTQNFNSVYSLNGTVVWAAGDNGALYRSVDGGMSYSSRSIGTVNYKSVTGIIANIWVAGEGGTLLISTNAGVNFTLSTIGAADNINSMYFTDINTGWVCCSNGKIYKSTNAGVNWISQASPVSVSLKIIKFVNASTGFSAGDGGTVIITTNGGVTWVQSATPMNKNILAGDISGSTIMVSLPDGWVLRSTNLGNTWSSIDYKVTTKPDITGLVMMNANTYLSCGVGGFIRKSTDGGATFTYQNNPLHLDLKTMYFKDSLRGWCISGNTNVILRTTNGGDNWYAPTGTTQTLSWVLKIPLAFYTSSGNVFYQSPWNKREIFVTNSNKVMRSLDVGETWVQVGTQMPYGYISNSFFVSPKDTNIFLCAIDSSDNVHGKVLRSTNYGQTWTETFSGNRSSDGIPMEMDPNHTDTIYYGPTDSIIFRSTNFGLTWASVSSQFFENICQIKVLPGNSNTIIVGSAAFIGNGTAKVRRSTDWGATWSLRDSNVGPYPEVPAIATSLLDSIIYCNQYRGNFNNGVKRSFDKGATWSHVNIDISPWGLDISKDDPNVFVYAPWDYSSGTAAYITYNKGVQFTPMPALSAPANFAVYFYNRRTLFLQQATGIYKLKVDISTPIGIQPVSTEIPKEFSLQQNYPNPFNPNTNIRFSIPKQSGVRVEVYDAIGRSINVLVDERLNPGIYNVQWDASGFSSGVYYYRINTDTYTETRKMILLK
jgi:photosystem II stability/assembly factor-like uncharacterized protein